MAMRYGRFGLFVIVTLAAASPPVWQTVASAQVAVAHVDSGQVLRSQGNPKVCSSRLATALALLVFLEARDSKGAGAKSLERIAVPAPAAGLGKRPLELTTGESISAAELVKAALLTCAPEAAQALFGALLPSAEQGAAALDRRARALGVSLGRSRQPTRSGQPAPSGSLEGCSSLERAALLAATLLRRPEIEKWAELAGIPFRDGKVILRRDNPLFSWPTERLPNRCQTRDCLVFVTARRNGLHLVGAAAGPRAGALAADSLERAFAEFKLATIVRAGDQVGLVEVEGGTVGTLAAVARDSVSTPLPVGEEAEITVAVQLPLRVRAPIAADQVLGELLVERNGKLWAVVPLVSDFPVASGNWLHLAGGERLKGSRVGGREGEPARGRGIFSPIR